MSPENLSEQLFKDKFDYPETSTLVNRVVPNQGYQQTALDKEPDYPWYRIVTPELWNWRGLPALEIDSVLSRISKSSKPHTNDKWHDTVVGFQSGNWIYEFLAQSTKWQANADSIPENDLSDEAILNLHNDYLIASQYSSIASYPHYCNDKMADYAQTRAYKMYSKAMNYSSYITKEIDFKLDKSTTKGRLYLPHLIADSGKSLSPCPVVLICAGLGNLQIDFYRYFYNCLAPKGIAMLTVDAPSVGYSRSYRLTENSSQLYQTVLETLPSLPWIDSNRVILAGFRFGAHIAMRLAYLMPHKVKAVVNFKPVIHQAFVDETIQQNLPTMYKDMLADRLGLSNVSNQHLAAELKCFSLKNQGILNKPCRVPILSIIVDNDKLSNKAEVKLIQSLSQHKIVTLSSTLKQKSFKIRFDESAVWIASIL